MNALSEFQDDKNQELVDSLDGIDLSLDGYPTLQMAEADNSLIKIVIGPAGSAKTTWAIKSICTRSMLQEPARDGIRYTKWIFIRQTVKQLRANTLSSVRKTIGENLWPIVEHPVPKIHAHFPLPDGTWVDCIIDFLGMDAPNAMADLLGGEYTGAFLDEVSELPELAPSVALERTGRYPAGRYGRCSWRGVLGTTNGPKKSHWLYSWSQAPKPEWKELEERTGRNYFRLFRQPPALLRPKEKGGEWLPNPLAENVDKLTDGYNYYYMNFIAQGNDDRITAYVEGNFANLKAGKAVWDEFSRELHVIPRESVEIGPGAPLLLGADFGRTPVILLAICTANGTLIVIEEFMGENMAISTLLTNTALPTMKKKYRYNKIEYAYGDPAGDTGGQGTEDSPFSVLQNEGIPIEVPWGTSNQMFPRLEAVRKKLTTIGKDKKPQLLICDNCPMLIEACAETYVYEKKATAPGAPEEYSDAPTKTHTNWVSDLCDSLQYLCMGFDAAFSASKPNPHIKKNPKKRNRLI